MIYGFTGLVLTYVILTTLLLWMFKKSDIAKWKKLLIIPLTLWWSIALYFTPLGFMGYPVSKDIPDESIVISYKITEPNEKNDGGMYFWVIDVNKIKPLPTDPRKAFTILNRQEPRAYKLPYDRDLHKDISKKKRKQIEQNGIIIWSHLQKGNSNGKKYPKGNFEVINPLSLLPSKNNSE
jgi:hypothetical protein